MCCSHPFQRLYSFAVHIWLLNFRSIGKPNVTNFIVTDNYDAITNYGAFITLKSTTSFTTSILLINEKTIH